MTKIFLGLMICLATLASYAGNDSFLNYSPVYYFTSQDWAISQAAAQKALEQGRKINWSNPASGAKGYLIPGPAFSAQGTKCRMLTIFNEARGVTNQSKYKFCKINQQWKVVS